MGPDTERLRDPYHDSRGILKFYVKLMENLKEGKIGRDSLKNET